MKRLCRGIWILALIWGALSSSPDALAQQHHMRIEIVLKDGTQTHLVLGSVSIESTGAPVLVSTAPKGYVDRDLACDAATHFTAKPSDPLLEPSPPSVFCADIESQPSSQSLLVALEVQPIMISEYLGKGSDAWSARMGAVAAASAAMGYTTGYTNLDSAIKAKNSAATAHIATELAAALRSKNDTQDADFLSGLATEALGTQLNVQKPLVFDPSQKRLVASDSLLGAVTDYAEMKGLDLPPSNQKKINETLMQSLSGYSSKDILSKPFVFQPQT